ncbi:hypothetical protein CI109_103972 [Kwoniella shandongensis]|uniref:Protein ROT1 n=1 Tax=Kwoniella shandongensis TaxID=1734106 RepID=A0A5M6C1X4_9TREE|nr:uncharacterized protein CI109_004144 [Kwoniella shandongensis]KAA5527605.1 hypothetical protein CI109_004144 [Kwoniella shandongensis]
MLASVLTFTLALLTSSTTTVFAQGDLTAANNLTDLEGTWSSNPAVSTGGDICIPAEMKFNYPANTGISYSFTNDGFFEEVQYRYTANASNPSCITAFILWQHGTYVLNNDGSMTLNPFGPDGRIQVQDPCAATTNIITYYDQQTTFADWGIIVDATTGNYQLNLNRFDGAKMPYMYLVAKPPNMMPTQVLTGVNASGQTNTRKRDLTSSPLNYFKRSAAVPVSGVAHGALLAGVLGSALIGFIALV